LKQRMEAVAKEKFHRVATHIRDARSWLHLRDEYGDNYTWTSREEAPNIIGEWKFVACRAFFLHSHAYREKKARASARDKKDS